MATIEVDNDKTLSIHQLLLPTFMRWPDSGENLPAVRVDATKETLLVKAQEDVLVPCRRRGLTGVRPLGFHTLFDHILLVEANGSDWLVFPMEKDPIYLSRKFPMPSHVRDSLKSVDRAGAHFDAIYIAHELPKGVARTGNEAEILKIIAPPPPKDVAQLSANLGRASLGLLFGAFAAIEGAAVTGLALGTIAAAASLFILDPVILGAVASDESAGPGDPAVFFFLTSWEW